MAKWEGNDNVKLLICNDGYSHAEVTIIRLPFKTIFICDAYNDTKTFCLNYFLPSFFFKKSKKRKEDLILKKGKDWCELILRKNFVRFRDEVKN